MGNAYSLPSFSRRTKRRKNAPASSVTAQYAPTPAEQIPQKHDVIVLPAHVPAVHQILSSLGLPVELVLHITELAGYRPLVGTRRDDEVRMGVENVAAQLYFLTLPLPDPGPGWRVQKVWWHIKSRFVPELGGPQGWYDACIFRRTRFLRTNPDAGRDIAAVEGLYRVYPEAECMEECPELARAGWSLVKHGEGCVWRITQSGHIIYLPRSKIDKCTFEWTRHPKGCLENPRAGVCGGGFVEALQPGDRVGLLMGSRSPDCGCLLTGAAVEIVYEAC